MTKRCALCKEVKPLDSFRIDKKRNIPRNWCKQCENQKAAEYRKLHPEKAKAAIEKYRRNNKEKCRLRNRKWRKANPEKSKFASRNWYRRTRNKITECLYESIKQHVKCLKCQNAEIRRKDVWEILGYSYEDFIKHIEKQFQPGMTWDNHGEWEIDHIIPASFFQFQSYEDVEFRMCWRLKNIQPLWKHQNRIKGNKILIA